MSSAFQERKIWIRGHLRTVVEPPPEGSSYGVFAQTSLLSLQQCNQECAIGYYCGLREAAVI